MSGYRLGKGGHIDRTRVLTFDWQGRRLSGHPGDTLASALLANAVRVVGRSFKYHRPRGIMSAGVEEGGAIVTTGSGARQEPNVNAATVELFAGLEARGQNAWPSVAFDIGEINNLMSRFLAAGFYYKTFMGPQIGPLRGTRFWMWCEQFIRRAAGMGRAASLPDPDCYDLAHGFCDVLVVGSGPAGLAAAQVAAEAGLDVVLCEQDFALGGSALVDGTAAEVLAAQLANLRALGVRIWPRTTVFGLYDHGVACAVTRNTDHLAQPPRHQPRQTIWTLRCRRIILASGAIERGFAFGDNDRPGVMGAAALRSYLNRFGVAAGRRVVVATTNDSGYQVARELAQAGVDTVLLEAREHPPAELAGQAAAAGVEIRPGRAPLRALGRTGVNAVETVAARGALWQAADRLRADTLAVAGGWQPVLHLWAQRGFRPQWDAALGCFLPTDCAEPVRVTGAAAGVFDPVAVVTHGRAAGAEAARALGKAAPVIEFPPAVPVGAAARALYVVELPGRTLETFVDPQHDVTVADVRLAQAEGYVSVEHTKRYTTLGMANDQGKNGNLIALALMAEARGLSIPEIGTTSFRPPYTPVSMGALAGRARDGHFRPVRRSPMDAWHKRQNAVMIAAGLWDRPWYYPRGSEDLNAAYIREAAEVRHSVGLTDVSTLGKIMVQGPDAGEFLDRVYVNNFAKLAVGRARYGVMLRDDGIVMDDGTVWRLSENDWLMTTTTIGAGKVMAWLEQLLQMRWPELRVHLSSVTEQFGGVAVAGPKARALLTDLVDVAMDADSFPPMAVRAAKLGDIPVWLARLSFSGENAYEVYTGADYATALIDRLWQAARKMSGVLYGLEALGTLRLEKGHITGAEMDGRTTLADLGLGKMASKTKPYIGYRLSQRENLTRPDRQQLVGIIPRNRGATFNGGSILCTPDHVAGHGIGWVSGVTYSPVLGHWIGQGFIEGGYRGREGQVIIAADPLRGQMTEVEIVSTHFYDPEGRVQNG